MAMTLKPKSSYPNGKSFATIEEELLALPKSPFHKCFENWKKRWLKCIISEGGCFEGDKIVIDK